MLYSCDEKDIIKFDAEFDEDFDNVLIDIIKGCKRIYFLDTIGFGLKTLPSNSKFNKSVDLLPETITHIKFAYSFNQPVNNLPPLLVWLEFGKSFNQPVNCLPHNITYLVFGDNFSQPINDLPNCLEYLSLGNDFNYSIDSLPESLLFINIGSDMSKFKQKTNSLPQGLNNLTINKSRKKYPIKYDFVNQLNKLLNI